MKKYLLLLALIGCEEKIHYDCKEVIKINRVCMAETNKSTCSFETMEECAKFRDENEVDGLCVGYKTKNEECEDFDLNILGI